MGKVAIDFKINNTHNNTGQLFDFHLPFHCFISPPSLSVGLQHSSAFLIRWVVCSAHHRKCSLSVFLFHKSQVIPRLHHFIVSSFCLFRWYISEIDLLWRKSAPEHWGHMCVVAGAAASRLALLAAPSLYPAVCQPVKQGKRWDKWLFMICHLPSSQLSPGPIHYCCRLPLCGRKHTHTRAHRHTRTHKC